MNLSNSTKLNEMSNDEQKSQEQRGIFKNNLGNFFLNKNKINLKKFKKP